MPEIHPFIIKGGLGMGTGDIVTNKMGEAPAFKELMLWQEKEGSK